MLETVIKYLSNKYAGLLVFHSQKSIAIHGYSYININYDTYSSLKGSCYILPTGNIPEDLIYRHYGRRPNQFVINMGDPEFIQKIEDFIDTNYDLKKSP